MRRRIIRTGALIVVLVGVLASILSVGSVGFRASRAIAFGEPTWQVSPHARIHGDLKPVTSPKDYPDAAGASFLDDSRNPLRLTGVTYFVLTGHLVNGVVQYHYTFSGDPGSGAIESATVAHNQAKHTELIIVGTPIATAMATKAAGGGHKAIAGKATPADSGHWMQWTTWVTDILNITLTWVQSNLSWNYDGYNITLCGGWDQTDQDTFSGWRKVYDNGGVTNYPACEGHTYAQIDSYVEFENDQFCRNLGQNYSSYNWHWPNEAGGYYDGSWYDSFGYYYSGDCLSFFPHALHYFMY